MQRAFAIVLLAVTAPWTLIVGWPWVLFMRAITACRDLRWEENGILTAEWSEWVVRPRKWRGVYRNPDGTPMRRGGGYEYRALWDYSTTIGRGIVFQPGSRRARLGDPLTRTERHERVHVRQTEDLMLTSLLVALGTFCYQRDLWLSAFVWFSGGFWQAGNFLTAVLRGGDAYRDSEHERGAYAQTDILAGGGSWLEMREKVLESSKS